MEKSVFSKTFLALGVLLGLQSGAAAQVNGSDAWICAVSIGSYGASPYQTRLATILEGQQEFPAEPLSGEISSRFGWRTHPITQQADFHSGIDIPAASGTPVKSSDSGRVIETGSDPLLGNFAVVQHADTQSIYGHLSRILVAADRPVSRGTPIGTVGSTGRSTGPHLHFTVKQQIEGRWVPIDPEEYLLQGIPSSSSCSFPFHLSGN